MDLAAAVALFALNLFITSRALSSASEELEYFIDFASKQPAFDGDIEAGYSVVSEARAAIAKALRHD